MKILVIGGGGREHALAWKLAQSPKAQEVFIAPGNAGTEQEPKLRNLPLATDNTDGLLEFVKAQYVDLTVVGPEDPLAAGLVDRFEEAGCRILGPRRDAARLESSKGFCKDFMQRHHIPTARYRCFDSLAPALAYLVDHPLPVVIKADGLAAGKGVIIANTYVQAEQALQDMLCNARFSEAGKSVVIEEYLQGQEASFICLVDGTDVVPLASSQDHKARDDGGRGPNTGGMGAYSPAPLVTPELHTRIMDEIIQPTVAGLAAEGMHYRGFLYAGLMIDEHGNPSVLEYNCRFGDPETQPILTRLDSDFLELCLAATEGRIGTLTLQWNPCPALGVVLAVRDYPNAYPKGVPIDGLLEAARDPEIKVFHAGTAQADGRIVTNGGRVLCVVARDVTLAQAQQRAYQAVDAIRFEGMFCRRDIGVAALD